MDTKYIILGLLICVGTVLSADDTCSNLTDKCCSTDGCGQCKDDSDKLICVSLSSIGDADNATCDKDLCTADPTSPSPSTAAPESTIVTNATATTTAPETTSAGQNGSSTTSAAEQPTTANINGTTTNGTGTTATEIVTQTTAQQNGTTEGEPTTAEATTQVPPSTTTKKPCKGGQHFDAASFIGGIILCGGLVAIIWFSCRFYRSKTETKYQQF